MRARAVVVCPSGAHGFEVVIANLLVPGDVVTRTRSRAEANGICIRLATSMRLRALPLGVTS